MKRKFWKFVHDWLERAWHWVYRTKLSKPIPGERTFNCGSGEMGTLYWSKGADLEKLPVMLPVDVDEIQYWRSNPDGSYSRIVGPVDTTEDCYGKTWTKREVDGL